MDVLRRWRQWIRPVCFTLYFICLMIALPLCIIELNRKGAPDHVQAWFIGGVFVMMGVPISFWGILQHIVYYTQPELQRHIIRVLWMVPVYALNAWFALRFPPAAIYLDTLRECYEAYVIYNFMRFLINSLHQEHPHLDLMLENKPQVKHFFPFCFLPPWPMGKVYFNRCKHGVLQYTVVRPTMTAVALISQFCGKYGEGDFNFTSAWSYLMIINNISQVWAMYCLVLFYKGTKEELAPIKPVPKFLCVKAVIFLSFWQSTVIAALVKLNVIPSNGTWVFYHSVHQVATGLQDFLICVEMFLAAIAHYYSFSHEPYMDAAAVHGDCCYTFFSMWDVRDVRDDVVEHARYISRGMQKRLTGKKPNGSSAGACERTPLLNPDSPSPTANPDCGYTEPSTPPVMVEERVTSPGAYDARSLSETDWERSSETFHVRSTTPSMVNFAEFSTSVEVSSIASGDVPGSSQRPGAEAAGGRKGAGVEAAGDVRPTGVEGDGDLDLSGVRGDGSQRPAAERGDGSQRPAAERGDGSQRPAAERGDGSQRPAAERSEGGGSAGMKRGGNGTSSGGGEAATSAEGRGSDPFARVGSAGDAGSRGKTGGDETFAEEEGGRRSGTAGGVSRPGQPVDGQGGEGGGRELDSAEDNLEKSVTVIA